ncbi:hypothetical protein [Streptosporangium jomthongense]|uniref:Bacterial type II secretion system protein E domain-containing protein n=1 Tax=Streptosporangium jomthongense TaxID=1193683 RepID=A0ABV8F445_9ACTN
MFHITHMTYTRVAPGVSPRSPQLQLVESEVEKFLREHIAAMRRMTSKSDSPPPAVFEDSEAQDLFRKLHTGSDDEFLTSVDMLTKRLIERMNGRTAPGLLISLRAQEENERIAGVLKLQVVAPNGATLEELESGDVKLSAITNVLEKPGDLQKGALVATNLAHGRVLCGDRLTRQASYFPQAFGIKIFSRPSAGTTALFAALEECGEDLPGKVAPVLNRVERGSPSEVLQELGMLVQDLSEARQHEVLSLMEREARPVILIDTARDIAIKILAGDITISGPTSVIEQIPIEQLPDGGWQVVIRTSEQPIRKRQ